MNKTNEQLLDRVRQAKRLYKLSAATIAQQAGMATSTAQNQLYGKYKIDIDILMAILALCPNLSAEWLMRGNGTMHENSIITLEQRITTLENKIAHLV